MFKTKGNTEYIDIVNFNIILETHNRHNVIDIIIHVVSFLNMFI